MADNELNQTEQQTPASQQPMDPATQSLVSALRWSFMALKVIMALFVLWFLASGIFTVQENERAMILHFGKIKGVGEERILNPGLHYAWPDPIDEIVRIPVEQIQTLSIDSFWYFVSEREKLSGQLSRPRPTLDPKMDGYSLCRNEAIAGVEGNDYNIVHSKWKLSYRIDDPEQFFRNVQYQAPGPGETFMEAASKSVDPLLRDMAEDAIVTTMVQYSIDQAVTVDSDIANRTRNLLQRKLDKIESGIRIVTLEIDGRIMWPRQVDAAFQALNTASQEKQRKITEAKGYAQKTLSETGGADAEKILAQLKSENLPEAEKEMLLDRLSGKAKDLIAEAQAYRTRRVENAKANASYLQNLLPEYQKRPELVLRRIYQDALERVLTNVQEKILLEPTAEGRSREVRVLVNRDPDISKSKTQE